MFSTSIIEAITERDIDMLIVEELNVSDQFAKWFYEENHPGPPVSAIAGAYHSVSDSQLGESDIIAIYENGHAILIENKIGAIAQPSQALRYVFRGDKGTIGTRYGFHIFHRNRPRRAS